MERSFESLLLAIAIRAWAVDAPFHGHGGNNPEAKLITALMTKQLLDSVAESLPNKEHQTAVINAGKHMVTEAIRAVNL